ncbi:hypothetical protein O1R50_23820 [Glycomyces luteolus]|uniref:Uncharacterized protein n=1 Tax=Glycomyces luteolus TaxID=2670330 RepID=A0A9X3PER6_9ACTN|nr:hypothetical protein [Glycomyces luteolus]MDA1362671.1 hypothetical protein [Glycomyces luteolus]
MASSPTPQTSDTPGPGQASYPGAKVALWAQVPILIFIGTAGYQLTVGFAVMSGYSTAQYHQLAQGFILFTVLPGALHMLAAVNIGATHRGMAYLALSTLAAAVQTIVLATAWAPYGWCIAAPIAGLSAYALFSTLRKREDSPAGLERPWHRRLAFDGAVIVLTVALLITLTGANNRANDAEHPFPASEFDSSEASDRLADALDPLLAVLAGVEGLPEPVATSDSAACLDGGHEDANWIEFEHSYRFEDPDATVTISPNAGAGARAIVAVREHVSGNGWDTFSENRAQPWTYDLYATHDNGIKIHFQIGAGMTRLTAETDCVEKVDSE